MEQRADPGDLGRRVTERRHALGLSRSELAARAGMVPSYVAHLEESASANVTPAGVARLAAALGTTPDALRGGGLGRPVGGGDTEGSGAVPATLSVLSEHECRARLQAGGVGRLVEWVADRGPVATPVNFKTLDGDVVFRVAPRGAMAGRLEVGPEVSFEVDHFDEALSEGWSVLASGRARPVDDPDELRRCQALGVAPWAAGGRDRYVRVRLDEVTGRCLRHRAR